MIKLNYILLFINVLSLIRLNVFLQYYDFCQFFDLNSCEIKIINKATISLPHN
jgi:hypothetical protein